MERRGNCPRVGETIRRAREWKETGGKFFNGGTRENSGKN